MKNTTQQHFRHTQNAEVIIDAPKAKVWDVLSDFSAVDTWVPLVESSHIEGPVERGVGIERRCDLGKAGKISETVTQWDEGSSLSYQLSSFGPMKILQNTWALSEVGPNQTLVKIELRYNVKFGVLGRLLHFFILGPVLKSRVKSGALLMLKKRVETGEIVRPRRAPVGKPQRSPVMA